MAGEREQELDRLAERLFELGLTKSSRSVCADGAFRIEDGIFSNRFSGNVLSEEERQAAVEMCRPTMEKVVQDTFLPTPIPEGNTLMKPVDVRDFYDDMNKRVSQALGTKFDDANHLLGFFLDNYEPNLNSIDSTDFTIAINGKEWSETLDNATAADMGATVATLQLQDFIRQNGVIPEMTLADVEPSVINGVYDACIRSGHEGNSDPKNELNMGYCYSAGYEVGLRAFDELVAPMTPEQQRDLIQRQSERPVANR